MASKAPTTRGVNRAHLFASAVHTAAFIALLAAAYDTADRKTYLKQFWYRGPALTVRRWFEQCSLTTCDTEIFRVFPPPDATFIRAAGFGIPGVASIYVLWSAIIHFLTWYRGWSGNVTKWIDYTVRARRIATI